jgi:hypothetical protein
MSTTTWHEVIAIAEKLPIPDQLRLVSELLQRMRTTIVTNEPVDLLTLAGVGAEVWTKVDTDAYLEQERDSWQD